jgi:hypothetical protein
MNSSTFAALQYFYYVNDSVLINPNKENIDKVFAEL